MSEDMTMQDIISKVATNSAEIQELQKNIPTNLKLSECDAN